MEVLLQLLQIINLGKDFRTAPGKYTEVLAGVSSVVGWGGGGRGSSEMSSPGRDLRTGQ